MTWFTRQLHGHRDQRGSMVILMMIMLVTTGLMVALLAEVTLGMRSSRRAGDSANALQVADAGVNDASQQIPTVAGSTFTRTGTVGSGTYTYTATQDATKTTTWHIDVVGTDATGVKRHIKADAAGVSEFSAPIYVNNSLGYVAGATLDSYTGGVNNTTGCTRHGVISVSDGSNMSFTGSGGGNTNCTGKIPIVAGWASSMDACAVYGGTTLPATGPAKCPPVPDTYFTGKQFPTTTVIWPTTGVTYPASGTTGGAWTCNSSSGSSGLQSGAVYDFTTVTLTDGCGVSGVTLPIKPVTIYAKNLIIGSHSGPGSSHGIINAPTTSTCPVATAGWTYSDTANNPALDYCGGWPANLQVDIPTGIGGTINVYGNNTRFWGVVQAPDASLGIGDPQYEMWGAMDLGSLNASSQFSWHYDDSLTNVTLGKYQITDWREEPL
jgi:Tfp pilus assembly protein PilX